MAAKTHTEIALRVRLKLSRQCENPVDVSLASSRKQHLSKCGSVWAEVVRKGKRIQKVRCYHCHVEIPRKTKAVKRAA